MPTATDARGVNVDLPRAPQRIVSLVPSTTETLFALGMEERVVGITRFCVHPAERLGGLTKVGGTKDLVWERLQALEPDLVIGNLEENTLEMFEQIEARFPLYAALPRTVDEALDDLVNTGRLVGAEDAALSWRARIEAARAELAAQRAARGTFRYVYLIWRRPWMAANGDTFISAMLAEAGGINALADRDERYPTVTIQELRQLDLDTVLLSSEPFPFSERHRDELAKEDLDPGQLRLVDGELCSWHGVRMCAAFDYLRGLGAPLAGG